LTGIFLKAEADVNAAASKSQGRTALQAAVKKDDRHVIDYLLEAGAEADDRPASYL
jgi:ankyrin repeat protein